MADFQYEAATLRHKRHCRISTLEEQVNYYYPISCLFKTRICSCRF